MATILIVDDEPSVLSAFAGLLEGTDYSVRTSHSSEEALRLCAEAPPDVVVTDVCLPGMSGLEFVKRLRADRPRLPTIVMTGRGTMATAIEATQLGAFDYLLKPFDPDEMLNLIDRAIANAKLMSCPVDLAAADADNSHDALIGGSAAMQRVYKAIGRVAATDATVLIRGESGTGKELVARALYQHGHRSQSPMLVVNCAALPESLLESELFGHERGAFTGAISRRIGKFEQAHGGTLFLDEVGDVSPAVQVKLLRVLQERRFDRVGGDDTVAVDVRLLAATNRDLEAAMRKGDFREDLFHRLNVVQIQLPPLRDRRDDIPLLVSYFSQRHQSHLGVAPVHWHPDAVTALQEHEWPGNVRELSNCVYRLLVFAPGNEIAASDVKAALATGTESGSGVLLNSSDTTELSPFLHRYLELNCRGRVYEDTMSAVESALLSWALEKTKGNQSRAAEILGVPRPTFHAKLRRYGLNTDQTDERP